ncbi:hypothetical protein BGZ83_001650 [Gryganskiella cystojenkinii]|nr:hypothetical protein BGZ83_001650 [Gryganskiella cystojenkinii]
MQELTRPILVLVLDPAVHTGSLTAAPTFVLGQVAGESLVSSTVDIIVEGELSCGDIFCSAHCSKSIPLDQALDFNPTSGVQSRACIGCFEAFEQWQGLIPSPPPNPVRYAFQSILQEQKHNNRIAGSASDGQIASNTTIFGDYNNNGHSVAHKSSSPELLSNRKTLNTGHIPEGLLGSNSSGETLGREDIVRLPKTSTENIAIKTRPIADPTNMPMPSVPHDWSWND